MVNERNKTICDTGIVITLESFTATNHVVCEQGM